MNRLELTLQKVSMSPAPGREKIFRLTMSGVFEFKEGENDWKAVKHEGKGIVVAMMITSMTDDVQSETVRLYRTLKLISF